MDLSTSYMGLKLRSPLLVGDAAPLVLFNQFYQPDISLDSLDVSLKLLVSTPQDMHLALRWIAILAGRISANLAANQEIHQATDVIKM